MSDSSAHWSGWSLSSASSSHPPLGSLICLLLILSFFPPLRIRLSLSLCCRFIHPGQKDQAGDDSWLRQQPSARQAERRERRSQSWPGWVEGLDELELSDEFVQHRVGELGGR